MDENNIYGFFQKIGIKLNPLPANYNPDDYAKRLLPNFSHSKKISYSSSSELLSKDINKSGKVVII